MKTSQIFPHDPGSETLVDWCDVEFYYDIKRLTSRSNPRLKGLLRIAENSPEPVTQTNIIDAGSSLDLSPTLVRGCRYVLKYATKFFFSFLFISWETVFMLV